MTSSTGRFLRVVLLASLGAASVAHAQQRGRRPARPAARTAASADGEPAREQPTLADLDRIVEELQSNEPDRVREAIDLLSVIDHPRVVPPLAALLRAGQPDAITDRALEALRGLGSPDSIDVLTELTGHRRAAVRRRAYLALAAIEDSRVPALLEQGLRDSDRGVRGAVALALGEIGARQSLEVLFLAFERGVVESAIAIGQVGDEASIARFDTFLGRQPVGVMLSGYEHFLRRDDIPIGKKREVVERLGEVASVTVKRFLQEYLGTFPTGRDRNRERVALRELVEQTAARISDRPRPAGGGAEGPPPAPGADGADEAGGAP